MGAETGGERLLSPGLTLAPCCAWGQEARVHREEGSTHGCCGRWHGCPVTRARVGRGAAGAWMPEQPGLCPRSWWFQDYRQQGGVHSQGEQAGPAPGAVWREAAVPVLKSRKHKAAQSPNAGLQGRLGKFQLLGCFPEARPLGPGLKAPSGHSPLITPRLPPTALMASGGSGSGGSPSVSHASFCRAVAQHWGLGQHPKPAVRGQEVPWDRE